MTSLYEEELAAASDGGGFQVYPKKSTPHLDCISTDPLDGAKALSAVCSRCGEDEVWICLQCHAPLCSRYKNGCAKKHADARSQVLALRGGSNYPVALYGNGAVALAYASLMIFAPNTLLTAYGAPPEELLSAAYGALQYCGGFYAMVVLRAYAALTGKRDQGETVEAFTYLNATHLAIAAFRAFKGSSASLKNCAIFGTLLLLNSWAALE